MKGYAGWRDGSGFREIVPIQSISIFIQFGLTSFASLGGLASGWFSISVTAPSSFSAQSRQIPIRSTDQSDSGSRSPMSAPHILHQRTTPRLCNAINCGRYFDEAFVGDVPKNPDVFRLGGVCIRSRVTPFGVTPTKVDTPARFEVGVASQVRGHARFLLVFFA